MIGMPGPCWMRVSGKPCTEYTVSSTSDAVRKPKSYRLSLSHNEMSIESYHTWLQLWFPPHLSVETGSGS